MKQLGIWSRALSSEEVDAIFVAGRSYGRNILEAFDPLLYYESYPAEPMPATIIASYDFEANLMDSSGNDLTGEYSDGEGFTFESTLDGHHLNLNNTNRLAPSFVTLPDSEQLDFGASFDFTMYVYYDSSLHSFLFINERTFSLANFSLLLSSIYHSDLCGSALILVRSSTFFGSHPVPSTLVPYLLQTAD